MNYIKRRTIAVATMCAVLMASTAILPAGAEGGSKTVEYYKYDLQLEGDDVRFSSYPLTITEYSTNARLSIDGVTPPDTRVPDTNSSIVRVRMHHSNPYGSSGFASATGFIVDDHTIATAAHVVYKPNSAGEEYGVEYGYVYVYDEVLGRQVEHAITEVHIPEAYTTSASHDYDYALVTVDADLSQYGVFELGCIADEAGYAENITLSVSGFPGELLDENGEIIKNTQHQLYTGTGRLIQTQNERLFYTNDASPGNSGGPVYVTTRYTTDGTNWTEYDTVVGICTGADDIVQGTDTEHNDAKRITEPVLQFYLNNPNIGY